MIFGVAFGLIALILLGLYVYRRKYHVDKSSEADIYSVVHDGAFGGVVGKAYMNKLGVQGEEITMPEDHEPVKFKFDSD